MRLANLLAVTAVSIAAIVPVCAQDRYAAVESQTKAFADKARSFSDRTELVPYDGHERVVNLEGPGRTGDPLHWDAYVHFRDEIVDPATIKRGKEKTWIFEKPAVPAGWTAELLIPRDDPEIEMERTRYDLVMTYRSVRASGYCMLTACKDNVYFNMEVIGYGPEYKIDKTNKSWKFDALDNKGKSLARTVFNEAEALRGTARQTALELMVKILGALDGAVLAKPAFSGPATSLAVRLVCDRDTRGATADFGPGITQIGEPATTTGAKGTFELACIIKIAPDAAPGTRLVTVKFRDGKTSLATFTVHPLVIVLDLDGVRPDILLECIQNRRAANLAELLGKQTSEDDVGGNTLRRREFEHGLYLRDTATVFPSYTFATQASIFTGVEPGVHGVTGNMMFDRLGNMSGKPQVYGFDRNLTDALGVYYFSDLADQAIRADNIYQAMAGKPGVGRSGVFYNQYAKGVAPEDRKVAGPVEMAAYIPSLTTGYYDRGMAASGTSWLRTFKDKPAEQWPSIATFYFVGIDHIGHEVNDTEEAKQTRYIGDVIDPEIGNIVNVVSDVCPGAIFLLTADHGHTDVRAGKPITRAMLKQAVARDGKIDPNDLEITQNGGLAHVHVRARKNGQLLEWRDLPSFDRVLSVAESISKLPYFDLVLVKNAEKGGWDSGYRVYLGGGKTEDIAAYLRRTKNDFGVRLGWSRTETDILFLTDRLNMYTCDRSGDVVPVPTYPDFYMEDAPVQGEHGSLNRQDMTIPFMVAQWQAFDTDPLLAVLKKTVENPSRPRVTDVAPTIAGFLGQSFRGRKISPRFAEAPPDSPRVPTGNQAVPVGEAVIEKDVPLHRIAVTGGTVGTAAKDRQPLNARRSDPAPAPAPAPTVSRPAGQGYFRLKEGYPKLVDAKKTGYNYSLEWNQLPNSVSVRYREINPGNKQIIEDYTTSVSVKGLDRPACEPGEQFTFSFDGTWQWNKDCGKATSITPWLDWRGNLFSIVDAQPRHGDKGATGSSALWLGRFTDGKVRPSDHRDITLKIAKTGSPGSEYELWICVGTFGRLVWAYEWVNP